MFYDGCRDCDACALQVVTVKYVKNDKKYSLVLNEDTITVSGPDGTDNIPVTEEKSSIGSSEFSLRHHKKSGKEEKQGELVVVVKTKR